MNKRFVSFLLISLMMSLAGCGGGSGSSAGRGGVMDGELTLKITDAPIDSALAVWVRVSGITLNPADGSHIYFDFNDPEFNGPLDINLLNLQLGKTEILLEDVQIPAGKYNWVRLHVETENALDSYIVMADGSYELTIPSGEERGLQLIKDLEVQSNGDVNLVIDFDLRQSIVVEGSGDDRYKLKPVLRLVDMDSMGSIAGVIDPALLTSGDCSDTDPATGNAVYVFEGADVTPDDIDGNDDPVATSTVLLNADGAFEYSISYIEAGDYTVAFTCQADLDDPGLDEVIVFSAIENVEVVVEHEMDGMLR